MAKKTAASTATNEESKEQVAPKTTSTAATEPTKKVVKKAPVAAKAKEPEAKTEAKAPAVKKVLVMPGVHDTVQVAVDGTECVAVVIGLHDGSRVDVVVQPVGADSYTLGTVKHKSMTKEEPYWYEK